MQQRNWTDLSYLVALARAGRLALASERLKVDATTISRRIAILERALGARLFERDQGRFTLTAAGQKVALRAERIEFEVDEIKREVAGVDAEVFGLVRVTAPPWMVSHVLLPSLSKLQEKHNDLTLELIAEARNLDVARRDADIAVRMSRPVKEQRAVARRLTSLDFAVYGPADADPHRLRWISFESNMSGLPQSAWIADAMRSERATQPALLVNDSAIALHAIAAGIGKTILPCVLGDRAMGVVRLSGRRPILSRDVWLMTHPELRNLSRIRVVHDWLETAISTGKSRKRQSPQTPSRAKSPSHPSSRSQA
jgi:DNA-binding transcriptional LysR family regulator